MIRIAERREIGATKNLNPPNPYHGVHAEWIDCPPPAMLEVYEEQSRSIITHNKSPDVGFEYSANPYHGCFHGCAYCYARPSHQYLDFGAGSDFERKLIAKVNAPELLRKEFLKKSWKGGEIVFSGITDCYQPLEAHYELTRRCLLVCDEFNNPVSIITKGALIRRDIDVLSSLASKGLVKVFMSIAFASDHESKLIEPGAPRPSVRFRALKELSDAGIPVGLALAPMIPALNSHDIPEIVERAAEAGAENAFLSLLRLPREVKDVFVERLHEAFPTRATKVINQIKAMRGGSLSSSEWYTRMGGEGPVWDAAKFLFDSSCEKFGLTGQNRKVRPNREAFQRPERQLSLLI